MKHYLIGMRVRALRQITEGGVRHRGDENVKNALDKNFIHASEGDIGEIVQVSQNNIPTVLWERKGTMMKAVDSSEIKEIGCYTCGWAGEDHEDLADCMRRLMQYVVPQVRETKKFKVVEEAGYKAMKEALLHGDY